MKSTSRIVVLIASFILTNVHGINAAGAGAPTPVAVTLPKWVTHLNNPAAIRDFKTGYESYDARYLLLPPWRMSCRAFEETVGQFGRSMSNMGQFQKMIDCTKVVDSKKATEFQALLDKYIASNYSSQLEPSHEIAPPGGAAVPASAPSISEEQAKYQQALVALRALSEENKRLRDQLAAVQARK